MDTLRNWGLEGPRGQVLRCNPQWTALRLERVELGYRHFLFLNIVYSRVRVVPHKDVDEFWHAHILHTRDYAHFCEEVAGRFLHHTPSPGGKPTAQDYADYENTRRLIRHHFGHDKDPEVWLGEAADSL